MALLVRVALAVVLGIAAAAKLGSPVAAAEGLETFGVPRPLRLPALVSVAVVEAALAVAVAAGSDAACYAAAALLVLFAGVLGAALRAGRGGAPCACLGARGRVGGLAVVRNRVLAAGFAAVPSLPKGAPSTQGWLLVGLVAAFALIGALGVALLALAREVGLLRLRLAADPALEVAGEGPPVGSRVALQERCDSGRPFAVALDGDGTVRAKGTFNTYGQLESILSTAERRLAEAHA